MHKLGPVIIGTISFDFSRPYLMGIVNVTPDSFSDGGQFLDTDLALHQIEKLIKDGADFIDIGAESTRPGAKTVSTEEEIKRLSPILKQYHKHFSTPLSLDTSKPEVLGYGIQAGINLVNNVCGTTSNPQFLNLTAEAELPMVIMHKQGTPETMQTQPHYENVVEEVSNALKTATEEAKQQGIRNLIIDPGFGFGKTVEHNLQLLKKLRSFSSLGYPVLVGTSNKSFIGHITGAEVQNRLAGSLATHIIAAQNGAHILRVHDVKSTKDALKMLTELAQIS